MYYTQNSTGVLLVLLCSSIVALSYNVIHSLMIQKTSAVTTTVLGEVKIVGLLILSALLLGKLVVPTCTHCNIQILQMRACMSLIRCCSPAFDAAVLLCHHPRSSQWAML